jgi:hypothetical protein
VRESLTKDKIEDWEDGLYHCDGCLKKFREGDDIIKIPFRSCRIDLCLKCAKKLFKQLKRVVERKKNQLK